MKPKPLATSNHLMAPVSSIAHRLVGEIADKVGGKHEPGYLWPQIVRRHDAVRRRFSGASSRTLTNWNHRFFEHNIAAGLA